MLSYRHAFHAGNFADVLKHVVLVDILQYLLRKEGALDYIDTHAGAGMYSLHSADAQKLQEYAGGIGKLERQAFPELAHYFAVIDACNRGGKLQRYPGSGAFVQHYLRPQDRAWLYELHPQDFKALEKSLGERSGMHLACADGLQGLLARLPPASRRALVLIDPSYEVKADYVQVVETLQRAHRKFATGVYVLWYPVVERTQVTRLEKSLRGSGIPNIQRFELGVAADAPGHGMTGSGLFVINPPWTLQDTMAALLPRLAQALAGDAGCYKCDSIASQ